MTDAVTLAAGMAVPGDVVLLAPAAASLDQFRDYAARGDAFAAAVAALPAVTSEQVSGQAWGQASDRQPDPDL